MCKYHRQLLVEQAAAAIIALIILVEIYNRHGMFGAIIIGVIGGWLWLWLYPARIDRQKKKAIKNYEQKT